MMRKRILSMILAVGMVFSMMPVEAFAASADEKSTEIVEDISEDVSEEVSEEVTSDVIEAEEEVKEIAEEAEVEEIAEEETRLEEEALPAEAAAMSGEAGETAQYEIRLKDDGTRVLTISGSGFLYARKSYADYPWGAYQDYITEIEIAEGITNIPQYFFGGENVASIKIPSTVTDIGEWALANCQKAETLELPDGLRRIGKGAFKGWYSLKGDLVIPDSVTSFGTDNFTHTELSSLTLGKFTKFEAQGGRNEALTEFKVSPDNIHHTVVDGVLYSKDMSKLIKFPGGKTVGRFEVPSTVISIEDYAFEFARKSYYEVVLPEGLRTIGYAAFELCGVTKINIPSTVTNIGADTFVSSGLKEIKFDGTIKSIPAQAFRRTSIETIVIPEGCETIGGSAFVDTKSLQSITIPRTVTRLGTDALKATSANDIYYAGTKAEFMDMLNTYIGDVTEVLAKNIHYIIDNVSLQTTGVVLESSGRKMIPEAAGTFPVYSSDDDRFTVKTEYTLRSGEKTEAPKAGQQYLVNVTLIPKEESVFVSDELEVVYAVITGGEKSETVTAGRAGNSLTLSYTMNVHDYGVSVNTINVTDETVADDGTFANGEFKAYDGCHDGAVIEYALYYKESKASGYKATKLTTNSDGAASVSMKLPSKGVYDCYVQASLGTSHTIESEHFTKEFLRDPKFVSVEDVMATNVGNTILLKVATDEPCSFEWSWAKCASDETDADILTPYQVVPAQDGSSVRTIKFEETGHYRYKVVAKSAFERTATAYINIFVSESQADKICPGFVELSLDAQDGAVYLQGQTLTVNASVIKRAVTLADVNGSASAFAKYDGKTPVFGDISAALELSKANGEPASAFNSTSVMKVENDTLLEYTFTEPGTYYLSATAYNTVVIDGVSQTGPIFMLKDLYYTITVDPHTHSVSGKYEQFDDAYHLTYCACGVSGKGAHDFDTVVIPPTASESGYTKQTCKLCGAIVLKDESGAIICQHNYETSVDDSGEYEICTKCDDLIVKHLHDFEWIIDKPATPESKGYRHEKCKICDYETAFGLYDMEGLRYDPIFDQRYTGKALKPELTVYYGDAKLRLSKDYSVSYKNNTNAGTATITVKGKGNFAGTTTAEFNIAKVDLATLVMPESLHMAYTGKVLKPSANIVYLGKSLKLNKDYEIRVKDGEEVKEEKTYEIVIAGINNFTGEIKTTLTVGKIKDAAKFTVSKIAKQPFQNGDSIEPAFTVKFGKVLLMQGADYDVVFKNNKWVGTASAVITGKGEYSGTKIVNFEITGTSISKAKVEGLVPMEYTGKPITLSGLTVTLGDKTLTAGKDYKIAYTNNVLAGTASVVITGMEAYVGTLKKTFKITPYTVLEGDTKINAEPTTLPLFKGGSKAQVDVFYNYVPLVEGVDFTVSYRNYKTVSASAVAVIKFKGNFKGTLERTYTILPAEATAITSISGAKAVVDPVIYDGTEKRPKLASITIGKEKTPLTEGVDYVIIGYTKNVNKGTATVKIQGIGKYYGIKSVNFKIGTHAFSWWKDLIYGIIS